MADSGDDGKTSSSESGIILRASEEAAFSMLSCGDTFLNRENLTGQFAMSSCGSAPEGH